MESLSALKESINIFNWQQTCNTFLGVLPSEYCISDGSYCTFDKEFNLSTRLTFSPATEGTFIKYYKISQLIHTQIIAN